METTREKANEKKHDELVDNLQALLEKNYDAEKGFKTAMADAKSLGLKNYLQSQSAMRGRFATELDQQIRSLNATPKESGSALGTMHRAWIDLKASVSGHTDEAVLEECIRGEKASVKEYEEKLEKNNFPPQIAGVLNNQLSEITNTLSRVRTLEDLKERE